MIKVRLRSEFDDKGTKKAKREMSGLEKFAAGTGRRIVGIFAAAFAFSKIKNFFKESFTAFSDQQKIADRLRAQLVANGENADMLMNRYRALTDEIQAMSGQTDDAILSAFSLGRALGLTGDELERSVRAAVGFADMVGVTMETAMKGLAGAKVGMVGELGEKMGEAKEQLMKLKDNQEKFNLVVATGEKHFRSSAAQAGTYSRQLNTLSDQWSNLKKTIGGVVAGVIEATGWVGRLADVFKRLADTVSKKFGNNIKNSVTAPIKNATAEAKKLATETGKAAPKWWEVGSKWKKTDAGWKRESGAEGQKAEEAVAANADLKSATDAYQKSLKVETAAKERAVAASEAARKSLQKDVDANAGLSKETKKLNDEFVTANRAASKATEIRIAAENRLSETTKKTAEVPKETWTETASGWVKAIWNTGKVTVGLLHDTVEKVMGGKDFMTPGILSKIEQAAEAEKKAKEDERRKIIAEGNAAKAEALALPTLGGRQMGRGKFAGRGSFGVSTDPDSAFHRGAFGIGAGAGLGSSFKRWSKASELMLRRGEAAEVKFASLSGGDLFDALRGASKTQKELGEKGNPMHVHVENNPQIGVQ